MAKLVTRTFNGTNVVCLVYDKTTNTTTEKEIYLSGKYDDEEKVEKAVVRYLKDTDYRFVAVLSFTDASELRGMSENKFRENSVVLDKDTRKEV